MIPDFCLQHAALTRKTKLVEMFLDAGADVNAVDGSGKTPLTCLMSEFIRPHTKFEDINPDVMAIIIMLMQAGADLNLTICEPSNALITAILLQIEPLVRYFICEGAQIDIQCEYHCCYTLSQPMFQCTNTTS